MGYYVPAQGDGGCAGGCGGCLVMALILGIAFIFVSVVALVMIVVGYIIYRILVWLFSPQPRLFGAWPMSRWTMFYEHMLFQLETRTLVDFNSTPMRLLMGALIISVVPLTIIGWLMSTFHPDWQIWLPAIGLLLGILTGLHQSQAPDWFMAGGFDEALPPELTADEDALLLGDPDW